MASLVSRIDIVALIVVAVLTALPASGGTPPVSSGEVLSLAPMLERVIPGVVSIAVEGHMPAAENPLLPATFPTVTG